MHAGNFVGMGRDHTLYAKVAGRVQFQVKGPFSRQYVNIIPEEVATA
jgi:large subunit ribosomal protein L27